MQENALSTTFRRQTNRRFSLRRLTPIIGLLLLLAAWQALTMAELYPAFIIPTPISVFNKLFEVIRDGRLWLHTSTTLGQMLFGLGIGLLVGLVLGYLIAKNRTLEDLLSPIIVAFQSTPVVAYAPLLVIWFGSGPTSKVITSALIVFFPMLMNTIIGIRSVPASLRDLMGSLGASRWQVFAKLEIPAAMPVLIGGLKVSATLAVVGAVVGEFVSASAGLGFLINVARQQYDTPLVMVAVLTLAVIARAMYGAVTLVETRVLAWQRRTRRGGSLGA
jgi:NitT/TauT family transport system permease protein